MHEQDDTELQQWMLFIYRVPQNPAGPRAYVWRRLKGLGAAYLQQAAAILPDYPELREALETLVNRVYESAGEASLLTTTSPTLEWQAETINRFNEARNEEYAELTENVERFEDEISRESRRCKFTFAELEDLESDWEKLQRWSERIHARDFFGASQKQQSETDLQRARKALEVFTASVYAHEDPTGIHQ